MKIKEIMNNLKNKIYIMTQKEEKRAKKRIIKIHGKYYDLTNFNHPGGPIAIMAANGRDATALFESHHIFSDRDKINKIMEKYEIPEDKLEKYKSYMLPGEEENYDLFDWNETLHSDFTKDLKTNVYNYFEKISKDKKIPITQAIKANNQKWFECYLFGGMTLISFYHMIFSDSLLWSWINTALFPFFYWLCGSMYHDGSHFAISNDWRINWYIQYLFFMFSSPYTWLHQHVIGHHQYTNIDNKDPDLHHSPNLFRYKKSDEWRPNYENQEKSMWIYWPFATMINVNIDKPFRLLITNVFNSCVYRIPVSVYDLFLFFSGRLWYIIIFLIMPLCYLSIYSAVKYIFIPNMIYSTLFLINAQLNHFQNNSIHARHKNWFIHQIMTSNNFGGLFHYYTSIGLNYQIEHHLFPSVNSCHHSALQKIVLKLCIIYGVPYNYREGYIDSLKDHFKYMRKMGKKNIMVETNVLEELD